MAQDLEIDLLAVRDRAVRMIARWKDLVEEVDGRGAAPSMESLIAMIVAARSVESHASAPAHLRWAAADGTPVQLEQLLCAMEKVIDDDRIRGSIR